jgi:hypothetical protein
MTGKLCLGLSALIFTLGLGAMPSTAPAGEPSPEYRAALKRTAELRKQRRRDRTARPPGMIVPYPLPPALIIRQTPAVHDEIGALLDLLRR